MNKQRQSGFSLVELAIVILIMGLVLGGIAMPLSVQRENSRIRNGDDQIAMVQSAVEGFALANGHLPCPATPASAGVADPSGGGCATQHGFVPATTLDLHGSRNDDNLLLDPWGAPLRYSVTASDVDADGNWDFTAPGEMRDVSMALLQPDIHVCSSAAGASNTACAAASVTLSAAAPMIVYSLGKDWSSFSSPDQLENVGTTLGGGASGTSYRVADNVVFVSRSRSQAGGDEFDDQLLWLSANNLFRRLADAGHLP